MTGPHGDLLDRVADIIRRNTGCGAATAITERTTAKDVPGWDSLTHVQIILAVEKAFGFRMKAAEVARLEDVGSLTRLIETRVKPT